MLHQIYRKFSIIAVTIIFCLVRKTLRAPALSMGTFIGHRWNWRGKYILVVAASIIGEACTLHPIYPLYSIN